MESDIELDERNQLTLLKMLLSKDFDTRCTALTIIGQYPKPGVMINFNYKTNETCNPEDGLSFMHWVRWKVYTHTHEIYPDPIKRKWINDNKELIDKLLHY